MSGTRSVNADPDEDVYVTLGDDWFYFSGVAETSGDDVPGQPGVRAYTIPASGARCGSRIACVTQAGRARAGQRAGAR